MCSYLFPDSICLFADVISLGTSNKFIKYGFKGEHGASEGRLGSDYGWTVTGSPIHSLLGDVR